MRSGGGGERIASRPQFNIMQRSLRQPLQLRRFLGLLTLVVLPRVALGESPLEFSCGPPEQLENGFMEPHLDAYEKGSIIKYFCNSGFKLIGTHVRKCMTEADSAWWNATTPWCQSETSLQLSCGPPEQLENGFMEPRLDAYETGSIIKYYCNSGFKLIGTRVLKCMAEEESAWWNATTPQCQRIFCEDPPIISNGFYTETSASYTYGTVVTVHCNHGFSLIGTPTLSCDFDDRIGEFWNGNLPRCTVNFMETNETPVKSTKVVQCENPVVEHGILLSGFRHTYTFGNIVTFECVIGYFMVGSYLIRCNEDNLWNPEVPSCRKIAPDLCGAPLIPSGSVHPLHHQYIAGTEVVVLCNPQQCFPDETIEMSTVCQGYNFWEPPVWPCFLRTSPDTSKLKILNGRIIGKKKIYNPGDNVTIQCYAGYSLRGSPTIRYIGGKKWLPDIPSCSLSFFFVLLILAIVFIILLLPVKMLCNKCFSQ